jgi:hypothetical protein
MNGLCQLSFRATNTHSLRHFTYHSNGTPGGREAREGYYQSYPASPAPPAADGELEADGELVAVILQFDFFDFL